MQRCIGRWRIRHPQAVAAHRLVQQAVRRGELQRLPCEVCGNVNAPHAHHIDYAIPYAVTWLCSAHHIEHHRVERLHGRGQSLFGFMELMA